MDSNTSGAGPDLRIVVEPEPYLWEQRFVEYAASSAGWLGGDSTRSVPLSTGQRLWLFSDTLLAGGRMIHNCVVVEEPDGRMRTVHGGTATNPAALVEPQRLRGDDGLRRWLWTTDALALDGPDVPSDQCRLAVWFQEFQATKPDGQEGEWDFRRVRPVLVQLSLPGLVVMSRSPVEDGTGVHWGACVRCIGDEVLLYGVDDQGASGKHLLLAKTSVTDLTGDWTYWSIGGWSGSRRDAVRLLTGVSYGLSVVPLSNGSWLMITSDTTAPHGSWPIVAYWAEHPTGPWIGPRMVYDPPENSGTSFAYDPTLIPLGGNSFALGYNVNASYSRVREDRLIYRPRFRRVRISTQSLVDF